MKIPRKLKIGGHIITVTLRPLEDLNGVSDFSKNDISIDSSMPSSQKEATLIHEILHYCNPTLDDTPLGHALLDSLSEQLYQVLSDNKLLR